LLSLFPYEDVRPIQRAALEIVATMFATDKRFSILEAPTGSGKSVLAFKAARYAGALDYDDEFEPGAYVLTPYNNLVDAMALDFGDQGLASLKGRNHYRAKSGGGNYSDAKAGFFESLESVTSYAYFLRFRNAPNRKLLIFDEAHNLERILLDMASFRLTSSICNLVGIDGPTVDLTGDRIVDWLGGVLLPTVRKQASRCRDLDERQELENIAGRVARCIGMIDRTNWFAWIDQGILNVKPFSVISEARDLFARARYVLIQSATIFDFAAFQRIHGITDSLIFSATSDFPLRNRPIIYKPAGNMGTETINRAMPGLCTEIERIVGSFGGRKGGNPHEFLLRQPDRCESPRS
jgi:hypothetical protein